MKGLKAFQFYLPLPSLVYRSQAHASSKTPNTRASLTPIWRVTNLAGRHVNTPPNRAMTTLETQIEYFLLIIASENK